MRLRNLALAGIAVSLFALPALAHHSFAMFDADKIVELTGTVKDLEWTNPHSWLEVAVIDAKGQSADWALEMGSPSVLARQGWKPKIVQAGDRVTVRLHPLKDGTAGGQFLSVVLPSGQKLGQDTPAN